LKLSLKILLTGVVTIALFAAALVWIYPRYKAAAYEAKFEKTRELTQAAWTVLDYYGKQASSGAMTLEQAQSTARQVLKGMRYGGQNYFWINDLRPRMIMHPTDPSLDGKDLSSYQDPNGVRLFVELSRQARTDGQGQLSYLWNKPGSSTPVPKISCVRLYAPWNWVVGSGIYVDDVEAALRRVWMSLVVIGAVVCLFALGLSWWMARSLTRPVQSIAVHLRNGANRVAAVANQVAQASRTLAQGSAEQAASVQETSASIDHLSGSVNTNSDEAHRIAAVMDRVAEAVHAAQEQVEKTRVSMQEISQSGEQVKKIVKDIDEIAFQTNMLALNAAVEAARAGEAGCGFAVVADEVRKLAQRATRAAQDTADKIGDAVVRSERGVAISADLATSFLQIVKMSGEVDQRISVIANSVTSQKEELVRIGSAVRQIGDATTRYAGTSQETASAAQELEGHSTKMKGQTRELAAIVDGPQKKSARPVAAIVAMTLAMTLGAGRASADEPNAVAAPSGSLTTAAEPAHERLLPRWVTLGFEIRGRLEAPDGIGFVPGAEDAYYLNRFRLNATFKMSQFVRLVVQGQDSRVAGWSRTTLPASVENTLELRQAYLELGAEEGARWTARIGRQALIFGDMRLVSTSNWGNAGTGYDGARLTYRGSAMKFDLFGTAVVQPNQSGFDRFRSDRRLHGAYATFDHGMHGSTIEAYLFWKDYLHSTDQRGIAGTLDVYTAGTHAFGKMGHGFDYNTEMAIQTGHNAESHIRAWAGHWEASHPLGPGKSAPRLVAEYNYASGDGDRSDTTIRTFDNLYATDKYGTADGIAWRNIREPILSIEWKPAKKWKTKTAYHAFWLANTNDALYAIGGAVLARNPLATSGRVGEEIDLRVIYQHSSHVQIYAGYGYMLPGPYLTQSTKGGAISFPYLMWTYSR
jgi:methyl-accepting chemotaxis protein